MSTNNPRGFVEHRNLGGRVAPITRTRRVKAVGVNAQNAIFPGDPVVLVSGNTVMRIHASPTVASIPVVGVVRGRAGRFFPRRQPALFRSTKTPTRPIS
jgi:hypothetical protein